MRRLDPELHLKELAEKLGVDERTMCNWETNRTFPQLRFIPKIIAFLGYDPCDMRSQALGERIIAVCRRLGPIQRKPANLLDVDPSTLGRWERGNSSPSQKLLRRLNAFLTSHVSDQRYRVRRISRRECTPNPSSSALSTSATHDGHGVDNGCGGFCTQRCYPIVGSSLVLKCVSQVQCCLRVCPRLLICPACKFTLEY
jgi:transcriptional regulator with XRE-family HTH domain